MFVTGTVNAANLLTNGRASRGWPLNNVYYKYSGAKPKLSFAYDKSSGDVVKDAFYNECNVEASTASTIFTPAFAAGTQVFASRPTLSQAQNFARPHS